MMEESDFFLGMMEKPDLFLDDGIALFSYGWWNIFVFLRIMEQSDFFT